MATASSGRTAKGDPGTAWAIECAARFDKPLLVCQVDDPHAVEKIKQWMAAFSIETLSVGGPSESSVPGIGEKAYALMKTILTRE
jgi:hypothetical protein